MQLSGAIVAKLALVLFAIGTDAAGRTSENTWNEHAEALNNHAGGSKKAARAEAALVEIKKHHNSRHPTFYTKLNKAGATYLFTKITNAKNIEDYNGWEKDSVTQALTKGKEHGSSASFESYAKKITVSEIEKMPTEVCQVFTNTLEHLNPTTANKIPDDCRKAYLAKLADKQVRLSTIAGIPANWIAVDGTKVIKGVVSNGANAIQKLSTKTFGEIVKKNSDNSNDYCEVLTVENLNAMNKAQHAAMTNFCLAKVQGIEKTTISSLSDYPDSIFSTYNGAVAAQTLRSMSAEKLKQFASKSEDEHKCINLDLGHILPNNIASITADCLKGYLNGDVNARTVFLDSKMNKIPVSTFKEIKGDDLQLFGNFSTTEMKNMPVEVVQYIMDNETAIQALPTSYLDGRLSPFEDALKSITITPKNFNILAERVPSIAGTLALKATNLDDKIFSFLEPDTIKALTALKTKEIVTGYTLLDAMNVTKRVNIKAIVQNMGTEASTKFLSTIGSFEEYAEMAWLRPYMTESMVSQLTFDINSAVIKKAPELANNVEEAWKDMLEEKDAKIWQSINKGTFALFTNSKDFCEALLKEENKEILEQLPAEALRAMSAECTFILRDVLEVAMLPKLADNALAFFKSSDVKVDLNKLTVPQIAHISTSVADKNDSFFAKSENIEKINALDNARFASISRKQFAQMSDEVIKAIVTIEKIKNITPETFAGITDAQLALLPEEVLKTISVAQIAEMVNFATLDKNIEKLSQAQKDAVKERKEKLAATPVIVATTTDAASSATSEPSSNMIYYGLVGFGAIIIVAGIVFVIVRRK